MPQIYFSFLVLCLLCNGVGSIDQTLQPFFNKSDNPCHKPKTVNLLVMAPFPDPTGLDPGEDTGPIVIPASILAANSINARCDMLRDYRIRLLVADSGCNIITRAISGLVNVTFDPQYQVVGIIGPRCSGTAIEMGAFLAHPNVDLLHISPSATTPRLLDHAKFTNTFRTLGSSHGYITMYLDLIRDLQIKRLAIFYEHVNPVQAEAANIFQSQLQEGFEDVSVAVFGMSNSFIPLEQIQNRLRLVFVFGGQDIARRILCLAFHRNMVHPDYQFFFSELLLEDLRGVEFVFVSMNGMTLNCTGGIGDMQNATLGIMLSLPILVRRDTDTLLVDNSATKEFYDPYFDALFEYLMQHGLRPRRPVVEIDNHQTGYYDSVWAFALALNASIPRIESELGMSLDDYSYGHPNITSIIRSELFNVRFEGLRGTVLFSEETFDGENVTHLQVLNIVDELNQRRFAAEFDPALPQGERINITTLNATAFIPDSFDQVIIAPPIYVEVVVLVIVALLAITLVIFHVVNVKWTGVQSIKVTSPVLNNIIFSGCYIYLISILFISFERTTNPIAFAVNCSGFIWCETLAFSLIFGTICVKTWRILRIFSASSAKVISRLDNHFLVLYASLIVAVDILFNVLWNVIDPWFMKIRTIDEQRISLSCDCGNLGIWVAVLLSQKAVLTIVVLYLSIATRQVPRKEYKQTKSTNVLIYIFVLLNSLLVPVFLLLVNSESIILVTVSYLSICLKNLLCVIMCILLVFLPPILPLLKRRWNALLKRPTY